VPFGTERQLPNMDNTSTIQLLPRSAAVPGLCTSQHVAWNVLISVALLFLLASCGCSPLAWMDEKEARSGVLTPEKAAGKLLSSRMYGNYAIQPCIDYGEEILPYLATQSQDFGCIYPVQVGRLAEVLSKMTSDRGTEFLKALLSRRCESEHGAGALPAPCTVHACLFRKSIAAYALAKQGHIAEVQNEALFLETALRNPGAPDERIFTEESRALCALALGYVGGKGEVHVLLDVLPGATEDGRTPVEVIDALGIAGDRAAIGPLRALFAAGAVNAVGIPYSDTFEWAPYYGDRVLRALILLGDYDVLGLIIDHVRPDMPSEYWVLRCLRVITQQDFGSRPDMWRAWLRIAGPGFRLSAGVLLHLGEEVRSEKRSWLENGLTGFCPWDKSECFSSLGDK